MSRKLSFANLGRNTTSDQRVGKGERMKLMIPKSLLTILAVAMGILVNTAPVSAGDGDRVVVTIIPVGLRNTNTDSGLDFVPSFSLGYEHDPRGGVGAEFFAYFALDPEGQSPNGTGYGVNASLIAPHGTNSFLRGRLIAGLVYFDPVEELYRERFSWQAGVRVELGRGNFMPLVVEVLYRPMKVELESGYQDDSTNLDLTGVVFNFGFGFRFPQKTTP